MEIIPLIAKKRRDILDLAARCGARNVRMFGSAARGEFRPDSDLDILIDLERGRSLLDIIALKQDLEDMLNVRVDVVTEAALSPYIRDNVIREAVSL
jgi:predicted nucleotidyltransferase